VTHSVYRHGVEMEQYSFFLIGATSSLVVSVGLERVCNALTVLLYRAAFRDFKSTSAVKGYASMQVLGGFLSFLSSMIFSVVGACVSALSGLLGYVFWVVLATAIFSGMFLIAEYYPETLWDMVIFYNDVVGPFIDLVLVVPLDLANLLYRSLIPIWNLSCFTVTRAFYDIVILSAIKDWELFFAMTNHFTMFIRHMVESTVFYVRDVTEGCSEDIAICYDPGQRTWDLITPMSDLRGVAAVGQVIAQHMCSIGSVPIAIAVYPLLDINFAKGLHSMVNAVLYTVIQVPSMTVARCRNANHAVIMCLPDFDPSFNMLLSGLRSMGQFLDNWLDVTSVIIQRALGVGEGLTCEMTAQGITPLNANPALFEDREFLVVGLTAGLYAATDGKNTQYFNHYQSVESIEKEDAWPIQVEVGLGVAAVTFYQGDGELDDMGDRTTTLLGCRCTDQPTGMEIQCALSLYEQVYMGSAIDSEVDLTFNVTFQHDATKRAMRCVETEISVQSVRWPVTRFSKSILEEEDMEETCHSTNTCSSVDAVIWVAPRCNSLAGANQDICIETLSSAGCFPYCMAARRTGSGASNLILYNAVEWKNRVHLVDRDCGFSYVEDQGIRETLQTKGAVFEQSTVFDAASIRSGAKVVSTGDILSGGVVMKQWDASKGCIASPGGESSVGVDVYSGYTDQRYRSLPLPGNPTLNTISVRKTHVMSVSFANETLTTQFPSGNCWFSINIHLMVE
jgi:hypothetical protein